MKMSGKSRINKETSRRVVEEGKLRKKYSFQEKWEIMGDVRRQRVGCKTPKNLTSTNPCTTMA
jgi:hypothetical protein